MSWLSLPNETRRHRPGLAMGLPFLFALLGTSFQMSLRAQVSPGSSDPNSFQQGEAQDELAAAAQADRSGRYEEAARHYQKFLSTQPALALSPALIEVRTRLANAEFLLHRYRESLEALQPFPFDEAEGRAQAAIPVHAWLVRGLDYLDLNDLPEAIRSLRQSLALSPDSGTARLALGDALARNGQPEEAADTYRDQLRRTPGVGEAWYKLGLVYTGLAQKTAASLDGERGRTALPVLLTAEQLQDRGDYWGAAQKLFPAVHGSASGSAGVQPAFLPGLHAELGTALLHLGYPGAAGREFKAELSQNPESLPALLGAVEVDALEARWDEAFGIFERLMELYPRELRLRLESPPPARLSEAWKQGRIALPARLAGSPAGKLLSLWLGSDGLESQPRLDPPETKCDPAPHDELSPGLWIGEACAAQLNRKLGSEAKLSESQTTRLIELEYRLQEYEGSEERARSLLRSVPHNAWAQYWLSKDYSALAGQALAKLAELSPDSARVHEILAQRDADQNQLAAARREYEIALRLAPDLPDLHLGLGTVCWMAGDWTRAEAELEETLELSPGSPVASYQLGDSYVQQHQWQQAVGPLRRALADPDVERRARLDLAKAEAELGQTTAAIQDLLLLVPSDRDGEVHYRLAALYRKIGDSAKAQAALEASEGLRKASDQLSQQRLESLERESGEVQSFQAPR